MWKTKGVRKDKTMVYMKGDECK